MSGNTRKHHPFLKFLVTNFLSGESFFNLFIPGNLRKLAKRVIIHVIQWRTRFTGVRLVQG
jgi:hypothetical protein